MARNLLLFPSGQEFISLQAARSGHPGWSGMGRALQGLVAESHPQQLASSGQEAASQYQYQMIFAAREAG